MSISELASDFGQGFFTGALVGVVLPPLTEVFGMHINPAGVATVTAMSSAQAGSSNPDINSYSYGAGVAAGWIAAASLVSHLTGAPLPQMPTTPGKVCTTIEQPAQHSRDRNHDDTTIQKIAARHGLIMPKSTLG